MKMPVRRPSGFTLVEMLVGLAVSVILVGLTLTVLSHVSSTVRNADSSIDAFQSAEAGFDIMTQKLSDATLNTYYDYDNPNLPTRYLRRSDLHFFVVQNSVLDSAVTSGTANPNSGESVFFQVPAGYSNNTAYANTQGLLNACGYYVEFGPNNAYWPSIFTSGTFPLHYRYRLMQAIQPTEFNDVYGDPEPGVPETSPAWITPLVTLPSAGSTQANGVASVALPIAENVIALVILPQSPALVASSALSTSTDYQYNSRQGFPLSNATTSANPLAAYQSEQLPQILQLTMVAIDAASAMRLDTGSSAPPPVIEHALTTGTSPRFTQVSQYAADLAALEASLAAAHINYQVLSTSVTLRESKWSNGSNGL